jgi:hypothetical protein
MGVVRLIEILGLIEGASLIMEILESLEVWASWGDAVLMKYEIYENTIHKLGLSLFFVAFKKLLYPAPFLLS